MTSPKRDAAQPVARRKMKQVGRRQPLMSPRRWWWVLRLPNQRGRTSSERFALARGEVGFLGAT